MVQRVSRHVAQLVLQRVLQLGCNGSWVFGPFLVSGGRLSETGRCSSTLGCGTRQVLSKAGALQSEVALS